MSCSISSGGLAGSRADQPAIERLMAQTDWSRAGVGAPATWPSQLHVAFNILRSSRCPMMLFWGRDLVQLYNDACVPILGARHPAAFGQRARDCWPDVWDSVGPLLAGLLETGHATRTENLVLPPARDAAGGEVSFTFSCSPITDGREIGGVFCAATETAAPVPREREANGGEADRERDLRALSEALPAIVWTATPDGAGEYFNRRLTDYSGLTSVEAAGDGWLSIVHPDDVARAAEAWLAARETGTTYEVSYRLRRSDGEYRWFSARGVPLVEADGAIVRWIGTCIDIDEQKRSYDRERRASEAFQEAALPKALPAEPGISFSAVYQAGSSEALVGGDWYDAFRLLDGRIVLSVGDVMGSGLDAAVMMSAVRQSIRGAAQIYPEPCAILDAADRALRSGHPEAMVTAFVGVFDPVGHSITYASAGHPPPFLREETGEIVKLEESGPPLGLRADKSEQTSRTQRLPARPSMLVLYTDGFTEATRNIEEGEQHLSRLMETERVLSAADPAREIIAAITDRIHDDVAILVVRFDALRYAGARDDGTRPAGPYWQFDAGDGTMARGVRTAIVAELRRHGVDEDDLATAELLFSELLGNVVRHSGGMVEIALDLAQSPVLHVLDRGPGFTFTTRLPASLMNETGRGLFIVSSLAREFSVEPRQDGGSHARVVLPFDVPAGPRPSGDRQLIGSL